jgi:hypothetical protein
MITDFATMTGQSQFWVNFSNPIYYVDSTTTPMVTVMAGLGGTGFRVGATSAYATSGNGPAPIPAGAMPISGGDQHLGIVDRVVGTEWGFFAAMNQSSGWMASVAATLDLTGSGVRPPERNDPWWAGHGPRACGFGEINGLIGADEVRAGAIEHALVIAYPHVMSRYYTPPASTAQGTTTDALPTRGILCGGQIQLDPTLDVTTRGLKPAALAIARALQKYGAFVGDYSGATALFADASPTAMTYWNGGVLANLDAQNIPLSRFRVLQIGTIYDNGN